MCLKMRLSRKVEVLRVIINKKFYKKPIMSVLGNLELVYYTNYPK